MKDVNNEGDNFLVRSEPLLFTTLPSIPGYPFSSFILIRVTDIIALYPLPLLCHRDTIGLNLIRLITISSKKWREIRGSIARFIRGKEIEMMRSGKIENFYFQIMKQSKNLFCRTIISR